MNGVVGRDTNQFHKEFLMLGIKKQSTVRSAIGAGMHVNGDCVFEGSLEIDGTVLGDVTGQGAQPTALTIGESGSVTGAISADQVVIGGTVVGPVLARELLELHAKARVQGDVLYKALEMQQGAVIAGQLRPQITPPAADAGPAEPTLDSKF
jgi:cytoskeletal protein CcmA (bactofilin family)